MRRLTTIAPRQTRRLRVPLRGRRGAQTLADRYSFSPLLDAKAASALLGVPSTWLLAQARGGRIPHHRLGHYVRFSADDLREWLSENKITPNPLVGSTRRGPS
jgi:excisionase family DNA binding protein